MDHVDLGRVGIAAANYWNARRDALRAWSSEDSVKAKLGRLRAKRDLYRVLEEELGEIPGDDRVVELTRTIEWMES